MSKKNYRTLDGILKALEPIVNNLVGGYQIKKDDEDITIFCTDYPEVPFGGFAIQKLFPVLKRTLWMMRYSSYKQRVELVIWVDNDNK